MEFTRAGFEGPDAESRPSKHVFLFVRAALRYALASSSFRRSAAVLIRDTDLCKEDKVIWCSSLQSWMVPLCFSIMLKCLALKNRLESFSDSDIAIWRVCRRYVMMFGLIFMDIESFNESKQTSGCGVFLQKDFMEEKWVFREVVEEEEEELRAHVVEWNIAERSRNIFRTEEVIKI